MLTFDYDRAELYEVSWRLRRLSGLCRFIDRSLFVATPVIGLAVFWSRITNDSMLGFAYVVTVTAWCVFAPWLHRQFNDLTLILVMLDRHHCLPRSGRVKVKIAPEGIAWNSTYSDRFATWSSVERIVVDGDCLFIQVDFRTYNWIPRRLFSTDSEWTAFVAQVEDFARKSRHCKTPQASRSSDSVATRPRLIAYLLLAIPPASCYGIMHLVNVVPAGPQWMLLQMLMVSIIPIAVAIGSASLVAQLLEFGSKLRFVVLCCVQITLIFFVWQQTYQVLVTSWQ